MKGGRGSNNQAKALVATAVALCVIVVLMFHLDLGAGATGFAVAAGSPAGGGTPFVAEYPAQPNVVGGAEGRALSFDSSNTTGYFLIKPAGGAKEILAQKPVVEEARYENVGGKLVETERGDISHCVKASAAKAADGAVNVSLTFDPLCQRCGGNYYASVEVGAPGYSEKTFTASERFLIPCKADVLMVTNRRMTDGDEFVKDPGYEAALRDYVKTIGAEGLSAKYIELDSSEAQKSMDFPAIDRNGIEKDVSSGTHYSGEIELDLGPNFEKRNDRWEDVDKDSVDLPNGLTTDLRDSFMYTAAHAGWPETYSYRQVFSLELKGQTTLSILLGGHKDFSWGVYNKRENSPIEIVGAGESKLLSQDWLKGRITVTDVEKGDFQVARVNYTCGSERKTLLLGEESKEAINCEGQKYNLEFYTLRPGKSDWEDCMIPALKTAATAEEYRRIKEEAEKQGRPEQRIVLYGKNAYFLGCAKIGQQFEVKGEPALTKIETLPEEKIRVLKKIWFKLDADNTDEQFTTTLRGNRFNQALRAQIRKVTDATAPSYLMALGGTKVIPFFTQNVGTSLGGTFMLGERGFDVPSDDFLGAADGKFSRSLMISRMPTGIDSNDTALVTKMLRTAVASRKTSVSMPKLIADSCGSMKLKGYETDPCFIRNEVNSLTNAFYGSECGATANCHYSPPWCLYKSDVTVTTDAHAHIVTTEKRTVCAQKRELTDFISKATNLYFGVHGNGKSFGAKDSEGNVYKTLNAETITALRLNAPGVTVEACFGASIDVDPHGEKIAAANTTALAFLAKGARFYVGNTRYGWGRSGGEKGNARSSQLLGEFLAFALSPYLSSSTFSKMGIEKPAQQPTVGEAFLEMKKRYYSRLEEGKGEEKGVDAADRFALLTLHFYGDPTQKLVVAK